MNLFLANNNDVEWLILLELSVTMAIFCWWSSCFNYSSLSIS